jgi:hypothetical protein
MIRDWHFCGDHAQFTQCYSCGFLVDYCGNDGHAQCESCHNRGIQNKKQGKPYFADIIQWLKHEGISFGDFPLSFKFASRQELSDMISGPDTLGACFRETISVEGQTRKKVKVLGVVVLRGMPPELFTTTCVHELAHVWFGLQEIKTQPLWLEEGFCELWSYRYSLWKGTKEYEWRAQEINRNTDPVYGVGFQRIKKFVNQHSFQILLEAFIHKRMIPIKL